MELVKTVECPRDPAHTSYTTEVYHAEDGEIFWMCPGCHTVHTYDGIEYSYGVIDA